MPSTESLRVRRAGPDDADTLVALARELSVHQGDPNTLFTSDAVRRDGFGDRPRFEAWIGEIDGRAVGYALVVGGAYEPGYAQAGAYLPDVYVRPEARRRGVGRALMAAVAHDLRRRGLDFVWWVSRAWNSEAHAFFRTLATAEEPVVAFATFAEKFTALADEADAARDGTSDHAVLMQLNADYLHAVQTSDVHRFDEILAPDFLCTQSDGALVDRAEFLARTAQPSTLRAIEAHDVKVRILGDAAIVHARTELLFADGRRSAGRYTDVWARRGGVWLAVAAHVMRN